MSELIEFNGMNLRLNTVHANGKGMAGRNHIYVGCGVYADKDPHEWTGESLDGNIPVDALLKWALSEGYVQLRVSEFFKD